MTCGIDGYVLIKACDNTFSSGKNGLYGYSWYRNKLCSCIICNATGLSYVDIVIKEELPEGVYVGKYNFTYGEESDSIVADDGA